MFLKLTEKKALWLLAWYIMSGIQLFDPFPSYAIWGGYMMVCSGGYGGGVVVVCGGYGGIYARLRSGIKSALAKSLQTKSFVIFF